MSIIRGVFHRLPDWLELSIVPAICFGVPIITSVLQIASGKAFVSVRFTNSVIVTALFYELFVSAICLIFLYLRGYKIWNRLNFLISFKGVFLAIGLFIATYAAYYILWIAASFLFSGREIPVGEYASSVAWYFAVVLSLVNPLFEEGFLLGYVFDRLQTQPAWFLIVLTTLIRISYHLYQGWVGIIALLAVGILFALVYSKTKNLMPIYLCHALMDLTGLLGR